MSQQELDDVTVRRLLERAQSGDATASSELAPYLYDQLRSIARKQMSRERVNHTLSATAVVHEAYIRLLGNNINYADHAHFFAIVCREMRRVLVDHARSRQRQKRGGEWQQVSLHDHLAPSPTESTPETLLVMEDALGRLAQFDKRKAELFDLVVFGGLTIGEAAQVLQISEATATRDMRMARAWLSQELRLAE